MFGIWAGNHGLDLPIHYPNSRLSPTQSHKYPAFHPHPLTANEDLGHAQVVISPQKFCVQLDTQGYTRDELEVKVFNGFLLIKGESEEKGSQEFKTSRTFSRRVLLPENCKDDELICELGGLCDADTILKVTIPREVGHEKCHYTTLSDHFKRNSTPPSYISQHGLGHSAMNGYFVSGIECNKHHFIVRLDLPRFSPDEILIKTKDDFLVVEGHQEDREDMNGGGICSSSGFKRSYLLPLNADVERISCISEDGRLVVVVPRIITRKNVKVHKVEIK